MWGGEEDLGGHRGGETMIIICYMVKKIFAIKTKEKKKEVCLSYTWKPCHKINS